jgi:recombinational DNA repair ATPase RecF
MIRINSILIEEFRGIRKLTLDFRGKNFAICGPNGTGKSGVVDALEFVLTGNISRLSGEGRGEISLKQHAPHVDKRDDPAKARVIVNVTIISLKKTVTVERNAKSPAFATITPNEPDVIEAMSRVAAHPEIMLSRRELIRYVLATPGKRNEEVQALLHLDQIEEVRTSLQKIANALKKQLFHLEASVKSALDNLNRALGIGQLTKENILAAANTKRVLLNLPAIMEFTATTSLKDGMAAPGPAKPQAIPKKQALADIQAVREGMGVFAGKETKDAVALVRSELKSLAADPLAATGVTRENFYKIGISLIETECCPFCDTEWDLETLRVKVQKKLEHLKELSRKRKEIEKKFLPFVAILRQLHGIFDPLLRYAAVAKPVANMQAARDFISGCQSSVQNLTNLNSLADTIATLESFGVIPQAVLEEIGNLEKHVAALPEPTKQDGARDFLTIAQERLEVWREAKRKEQAGRTKGIQARQLSDTYVKVSDGLLASLYSQVEKHFSQLYSAINRNDEEGFSAKLIPSMGKLGFDVDFYGRGFFPPGAYHSEGHQDGMGLCLYLALMRHLQDQGFTFAVLDDVLMSVDTGHRREVCSLLKKEFPHTQFILTTHDPIWLRHMKTEGLISGQGAVQFRTWDVDFGPTQWDDRDVWTEINDYLMRNDVRSAAALLRHYLEHISAELCHRLRAPVEFRADAQFQLGELLPAAVIHLRKIYARAKEAANSWDQKDVVASIGERDALFIDSARQSNLEQWQVNAAVHYNSWDNLTKEDFSPVVKAFRNLILSFNCADCGEILRVTPERETAEALRCDCGKTNLNLRKKSA